MATDTVAPTTGDTSSPVPPAVSAAGSPDATGLDVARLTAVLDGRYAEVRALVRSNLVEHASILEEAETLSTADYRERVRDLVVEIAATGQTGLGFPEDLGGGGDMGASVAACPVGGDSTSALAP